MTPTPEQTAIIEAARDTKDNLLISALAGAAKTTTLVLIAKALPVQPILSLAFNKRIADEMGKRLPGHVSSKTLNSVGHGIWGRAIARRLTVSPRKTADLMRAILPRKVTDAFFSEISRAVSSAKTQGVIPPGKFAQAAPVTTYENWLASFEEEPEDIVVSSAMEILTASIKAAYEGNIDFDDQIYMPTVFGGSFPRFGLVMVDEAQDLSPLNHAMLRKLVTKRLIAVGDPCQSIYAFRGAMTSSMEVLRKTFNMRELPLSVTFRCPQAVVRRAWFRVPHMRWFDSAPEGQVIKLEKLTYAEISDGAAIICRNNAPLFSTALALLRNGRGCQIVGADIGPGLMRILKALGPATMTQSEALRAVARWEAGKLEKSRAKASTTDRADCLRVIVSQGETLGEAWTYAERLFASKGPIQLLSGHKAKGLEWDTVYHLDPWRIPSKWATLQEDIEQELNIRYVIETRARHTLYLIDAENIHAA